MILQNVLYQALFVRILSIMAIMGRFSSPPLSVWSYGIHGCSGKCDLVTLTHITHQTWISLTLVFQKTSCSHTLAESRCEFGHPSKGLSPQKKEGPWVPHDTYKIQGIWKTRVHILELVMHCGIEMFIKTRSSLSAIVHFWPWRKPGGCTFHEQKIG